VFGYLAVHILIAKTPGAAQAQQPATDPTDPIALPEDDPTGVGEERRAIKAERVLDAICVDKGQPLDDVIVDIFRQTLDGSPLSPPRFETFGRTKTKTDGRFSVALPPIRGKTEDSHAADMYVLYFTAPGRPIKSLIVADDTELPKEILVPTKSTDVIYLPTHYTIISKSDGVMASPMLSAIRGVTKDGKLFRVEGFVDERKEGKTPATGNDASMGVPGGTIEAYPFSTPNPKEDAGILQQLYAGRADISLKSDPKSELLVRATTEVHAELRPIAEFFVKPRGQRVIRVYELSNDRYKDLAERIAARVERQFGDRATVLGKGNYLCVLAEVETQAEVQARVRQDSRTFGGRPREIGGEKPPAADSGGGTARRQRPNSDVSVAFYALRHASPRDVARVIQTQFAGRVGVVARVDRSSMISVEADPDTHAEIRGALKVLDKPTPPLSARVDGTQPTGFGAGASSRYLAQVQLHRQAAHERLRDARQKLTGAATDDARTTARAELRRVLAEIFSQDMELREKQAAEVEARLAKLREQYQSRQKSKDQIINLQLKVIEQDAAGLGFPAVSPAASSNNPQRTKAAELLRERVGLQFEALGAGNAKLESVLAACNDLATAGGSGSRADHLARLEQLVEMGESLVKAGQATNAELLAVKAAYENELSQPAVRHEGASVLTTPPTSNSDLAADFNAIRDQYRKAKATLAAAKTRFNQCVADAQKSRPEMTVDELKKHLPHAWSPVERARPDFDAAHRLLEAKLDLLELERLAAQSTHDAKERRWVEIAELAKQRIVASSSADKLKAELRAAELNVERLTTLINLFKSIRSEPEPTAARSPADLSPQELAAAVEARQSELVRRECLAMLQGTWNCVAAGNKEKQFSDDELASLALQIAIKGEDVTVRYGGDDRKQQQVAGKLHIVMGDIPPRFDISIDVAGVRTPSRLSGQARIDRGVLRMNLTGDRFLIHRKFEAEPATFEFKRSASGSPNENNEALSRASARARMPVPADAGAYAVAVRDMLAVKPNAAAIDYDQPTDAEIQACRVVLEPGEAWTLLDGDLVLLRRFVDKNHDGVVDLWAYYKAGNEVYRDVDTDYDGKIDHSEGVDNGKDDQNEKAEPGALIKPTTAIKVLETEAAIKLNQAAATEKSNPAARVPSDSASRASARARMPVPADAGAYAVAVREMLAVKPNAADIDYDQPAETEIGWCRVVLEAGAAWSLVGPKGVLLRRFEDTNRDGVVDSWRYYKSGQFVYRDIDSDYDGSADRHERPEKSGGR
jgi:hypothetical protein